MPEMPEICRKFYPRYRNPVPEGVPEKKERRPKSTGFRQYRKKGLDLCTGIIPDSGIFSGTAQKRRAFPEKDICFPCTPTAGSGIQGSHNPRIRQASYTHSLTLLLSMFMCWRQSISLLHRYYGGSHLHYIV